MEKKIWKLWDDFLVNSWKGNGGVYATTVQFLAQYGVTKDQLKASGPAELFAGLGIHSRSPKTRDQLHGPVKEFFKQFFPDANELLWQGKDLAALRVLRRYKVAGDNLQRNRELDSVKRTFRLSKSPLSLISGTNAMHISQTRRTVSDWNTVKPSRNRQRKSRRV